MSYAVMLLVSVNSATRSLQLIQKLQKSALLWLQITKLCTTALNVLSYQSTMTATSLLAGG